MFDVSAVRADFPNLHREVRSRPLVYLDSAATSMRPQSVIDAESKFYTETNAAVHRGAHALAEEATDAFEFGRDAVARFVGGQVDEIAFSKNATESLNLVAHGFLAATLDARAASHGAGSFTTASPSLADTSPFVLREGDEIVVTEAEHHANLVPWQELARRTGAHLKWLTLRDDGLIDLDSLSVITPRTRIVAFTHVSNVTGAISPVAEIVAAAQEVGAVTVLDACQSVPHFPINFPELGVNFAAFSAHKMCGPTGVGGLWGKGEFLAALPPFITGGSMVEIVTMETTTFMEPPARFEAGSQPVAQVAAWGKAVEYLERLGMDQVAEHDRALAARILAGLAEIPGIRVIGPTTAENRVGAVAFDVEGVHPHDVSQVLDNEGVAVRVGHHCAQPVHQRFGVHASVRASVGPYTTEDEIDIFLAALERVRPFFGVH